MKKRGLEEMVKEEVKSARLQNKKPVAENYVVFLTEKEESGFKPLPFESMKGFGGPKKRKSIVLSHYQAEDEWLAECQAVLDAGHKIKELHCLVNKGDYQFLRHPAFTGLSGLYLYEAEKLSDFSFLNHIPHLNALLIDGAGHFYERGGMKVLAEYLKKQEEEHLLWRQAFDQKSLVEQWQDLDEFPFLNALCLRGAGIRDLSALRGLTRALNEINLSYNEIEDIMALSGLVSHHLFLGHNKICRGFAEVVSKMSYPIDIAVRHNRITDEELAHMLDLMKGRELIHIFIKHNFITDYSELKKRHFSRSDLED